MNGNAFYIGKEIKIVRMVQEAKITSKGQVTIPSKIRKELDLSARDKLKFKVKKGKIIVEPVRKKDLMNLYQSVPSPEGKSTDLKDIRKKVQKERAIMTAEGNKE